MIQSRIYQISTYTGSFKVTCALLVFPPSRPHNYTRGQGYVTLLSPVTGLGAFALCFTNTAEVSRVFSVTGRFHVQPVTLRHPRRDQE